MVSFFTYVFLAVISDLVRGDGILSLDSVYAKKTSEPISLMKLFSRILKKFLLFFCWLVLLYCIWLPAAPYYLWLRLKLAYYLLNLFSFYPAWEGIQSEKVAGEMFSFLPFLALYLSTLRSWKKIQFGFIGIVFMSLFIVEVLGRFFEKYAYYMPTHQGYIYISILLLGTLRVALPFVLWMIHLIQRKESFL